MIRTDVLALIAREGLGVDPGRSSWPNALDHAPSHRSRSTGGRPAAHRRPPRPGLRPPGAAPDPPYPGAAHPF